MNATWITQDVNTSVTTLQEALTATAEQDSNLRLIKWAVKVKKSTAIKHEVRSMCATIIYVNVIFIRVRMKLLSSFKKKNTSFTARSFSTLLENFSQLQWRRQLGWLGSCVINLAQIFVPFFAKLTTRWNDHILHILVNVSQKGSEFKLFLEFNAALHNLPCWHYLLAYVRHRWMRSTWQRWLWPYMQQLWRRILLHLSAWLSTERWRQKLWRYKNDH